MTLTVLVRQALRDGLRTNAQLETFVDRLRDGEAAFEDEASEGRDRSLGASLAYGFEHAFTDAERGQLAVLHLFQGFVDVDVLRLMGNPDAPWCLPELRGLTRHAGITLLDRGAGIGLLTGHGEGYYSIHPALPWFFRTLFEAHYPPSPAEEEPARLKPTRAFVEAISELGDYYLHQFECGNRPVIDALSAEEANLVHARRLARKHGWHHSVVGAMQGLRTLYGQTGRRAEWAQLVAEIVPDFVDATSDGPLPGREDAWSVITSYRVRLARESRDWPVAERLQRARVDWDRRRARPALAVPLEAMDDHQRHMIRTFAGSLHELGQIQRELGQSDCVVSFEEALRISEGIIEPAEAAIIAFNLGNAYVILPELRDLDRAEQSYKLTLEMLDERDSQGRARCVNQLGYVAYERFREARSAKQPEAVLLRYLNAALGQYFLGLGLLPANAVDDLRITHAQIGSIYSDAGETDNGRSHWREAVRLAEDGGDSYAAGQIRYNIARSFALERRFSDAREYALAALRNFEPFGDGASEDIQRTQHLLSLIEQELQAGR
jgi:tetratricopeptide (TPR) repeat protein